MDLAPGFPPLTYGRRPASEQLWICSVDAIPITGPFPAIWVSDTDATNPSAGIHCGPIDARFGRAGEAVARRLFKLANSI